MAITATLTVTPAVPAHGATVTAVYTVAGNTAVPPSSATVSGTATVGGQDLAVSTTVTLPGSAALPVTYSVPQCAGLSFTATADPATFTAVVP